MRSVNAAPAPVVRFERSHDRELQAVDDLAWRRCGSGVSAVGPERSSWPSCGRQVGGRASRLNLATGLAGAARAKASGETSALRRAG